MASLGAAAGSGQAPADDNMQADGTTTGGYRKAPGGEFNLPRRPPRAEAKLGSKSLRCTKMPFKKQVAMPDGSKVHVLLDNDSPAIHKKIYSQSARYFKFTENGQTFLLHRWLMNAQPGQIVDHKYGNKKDHRMANLRFVTRAQNAYNTNTRS